MKRLVVKPTLESVVRLFDEIDDFLRSNTARLRRTLSPKPRERRRVPRAPYRAPADPSESERDATR